MATPILRLLDDVVLLVFWHTSGWDGITYEDPEETMSRSTSLFAITATCREWRELALAQHSLWASLFNIDNISLWLCKVILERSGKAPLKLASRARVTPSNTDGIAIWANALDNSHHLEELYFEFSKPLGTVDVRPLESFLTKDAPLLRRVTIRDPSLGSDVGNKATILLTGRNQSSTHSFSYSPLFNSTSPKIGQLRLSNCQFDVTSLASFSTLTWLSVKFFNPEEMTYLRNRKEHWLTILKSLPRLERLEMINAFDVPDLQSLEKCPECSMGAVLKHLKFIAVVGNIIVSSHFLRFLSIPGDCIFHFQFIIEAAPRLIPEDPNYPDFNTPSVLKSLLGGACSIFTKHCRKALRQWDFTLGAHFLRIHLTDGETSSLFMLGLGTTLIPPASAIDLIHNTLLRVSEMPLTHISTMSLYVTSEEIPIRYYTSLHRLLSKATRVNRLVLDDTSIEKLTFEVLRLPLDASTSINEWKGLSPDFFDSFNGPPVFPNLGKISVGLTAALSRTTWGMLTEYLGWRHREGTPIGTLLVANNSNDGMMMDACRSAIARLPDAIVSNARVTRGLHELDDEGGDFEPWWEERLKCEVEELRP